VRTRAVDVNRVFHALSDATRRQMIERARRGTRFGFRAGQASGRLAGSRGSTPAAVGGMRPGPHAKKSAEPACAAWEPAGLSVAEQWIKDRRTSWERKFDRLGELLAAEELPDVDP